MIAEQKKKGDDVVEDWNKTFVENEITSLPQLRTLPAVYWDLLQLPLGVKAILQNTVSPPAQPVRIKIVMALPPEQEGHEEFWQEYTIDLQDQLDLHNFLMRCHSPGLIQMEEGKTEHVVIRQDKLVANAQYRLMVPDEILPMPGPESFGAMDEDGQDEDEQGSMDYIDTPGHGGGRN